MKYFVITLFITVVACVFTSQIILLIKTFKKSNGKGEIKAGKEVDIFQHDILIRYFLNLKQSFLMSFIKIFVFFLIHGGILFIVSYFNNTLIMPGDQIGLLKHGSSLSKIIMIPVFILLFRLTAQKYLGFISSIEFISKNNSRADIEVSEILEKCYSKESKYIRLKYIFIMISLLVVIANGIFTMYPETFIKKIYWETFNNYPCWIMNRMSWILNTYLITVILYIIIIMIRSIYLIKNKLEEKDKIEIRPLHPDRVGGLNKLGHFALQTVINFFPGILYFVIYYLSLGFNWRIAISILSFSFFLTIIFFVPLIGFNDTMRRFKELKLLIISKKFMMTNENILKILKEENGEYHPGGNNKKVSETIDFLEKISKIYRNCSKMPVWPFDISIISKFLAVVIIPILFLFLQLIIEYGFFNR